MANVKSKCTENGATLGGSPIQHSHKWTPDPHMRRVKNNDTVIWKAWLCLSLRELTEVQNKDVGGGSMIVDPILLSTTFLFILAKYGQ